MKLHVFEPAKHNKSRYMHGKKYLRINIGMPEVQKIKCTNDVLKSNRIIDEFNSSTQCD